MERTNPQIEKSFRRDFNLGQIPEAQEPDPTGEDAERDGILYTTALRVAHNAPEVRAAKVESIRAALAAGSYVIDAKRIAAALIREDPDLFRI
ncbi:MAG: flagellar biosynthesis anti-sigma factor FlgM [Desulfovibrio sp.]|nr:flagellar biosynthesis anti-sigma factor FlgM [Desulfovibrio sp.]